MSGFIAKLLNGLSSESRDREIGNRISANYHGIVLTPEFNEIVANTNVAAWQMDGYDIVHFTIKRGKVQVTFAYSASAEHDEDDPFAEGLVEGKVVAVIDDDDEKVQYEKVTGKVIRPKKTKQKSLGQGPSIGTPAWFDYWLHKQWRTSKQGTEYVEIDGHLMSVLEIPSGKWRGRVRRKRDNEDNRTKEYYNKDAAKRAVLGEFVRIRGRP